ncbi:MAG: hypothetical protein E6Q96_11280 [Cyclobacteriaceae bacterium]|nr:MAG: hypothetical protein E6Q96_11280 [Cyclobacteriaceae bacterium]
MKAEIIAAFPNLAKDPYFTITSPCTYEYNCIAWAAIKNDVFWWPDPRIPLIDGVEWPFNLPLNTSLDNFIQLYANLGYKICNTWRFEDRLQKIAIYINPQNSQVTHAARQDFDGIWTSKLGPSHDISHLNPYSLEGDEYGIVSTIMCRDNISFNIKGVKKFVEKA